MPHDIQLPLDRPVTFPPLCAVCEKPNPDSAVKLSFLEPRFSALEAASTLVLRTAYQAEQPTHTFSGIPACTAYSFTSQKVAEAFKALNPP
ncbi:MAG: hypothetical protein NZ528_08395 [Caldilineales bacterium]|nr:hypothetical protein [Caldilineales bacterium]